MAWKGSNKTLESPLERFKSVFFDKEPYEGSNKGFVSTGENDDLSAKQNVKKVITTKDSCMVMELRHYPLMFKFFLNITIIQNSDQ